MMDLKSISVLIEDLASVLCEGLEVKAAGNKKEAIDLLNRLFRQEPSLSSLRNRVVFSLKSMTPEEAVFDLLTRGKIIGASKRKDLFIYNNPHDAVDAVPEHENLLYKSLTFDEWEAVKSKGAMPTDGLTSTKNLGHWGPSASASSQVTGKAGLQPKMTRSKPGVVVAVWKRDGLNRREVPAQDISGVWYVVPVDTGGGQLTVRIGPDRLSHSMRMPRVLEYSLKEMRKLRPVKMEPDEEEIGRGRDREIETSAREAIAGIEDVAELNQLMASKKSFIRSLKPAEDLSPEQEDRLRAASILVREIKAKLVRQELSGYEAQRSAYEKANPAKLLPSTDDVFIAARKKWKTRLATMRRDWSEKSFGQKVYAVARYGRDADVDLYKNLGTWESEWIDPGEGRKRGRMRWVFQRDWNLPETEINKIIDHFQHYMMDPEQTEYPGSSDVPDKGGRGYRPEQPSGMQGEPYVHDPFKRIDRTHQIPAWRKEKKRKKNG